MSKRESLLLDRVLYVGRSLFGFILVVVLEWIPVFSAADKAANLNALLPCANKLFSQFAFTPRDQMDREFGERYESRKLADNFFYIFDTWENELHLFTPYFGSKSQLRLDKGGKSIENIEHFKPPPVDQKALDEFNQAMINSGIRADPVSVSTEQASKDWGPTDYVVYKLRIPHPNGGPQKESGYFYLTVRKGRYWNGHYHYTVNPLHGFLPRFSLLPTKLKYPMPDGSWVTYQKGLDRSKFHPLAIEDRLWIKRDDNFSDKSEELFIRNINAGLNILSNELDLHISGHMHGGPVNPQELLAKYEKTYADILSACQESAENSSIASISITLGRLNREFKSRLLH